MNGLKQLFKEIWMNRRVIISLAKNDFKTRFSGSFFGIIWGFVQPIVTILLFWFVFQVGFRSSSIEDVPFICWLASGLIPWFYFSDAWTNSGNCFFEYSFLVKKVMFKTSVLPIVKIISSLFVHIILVFFLLLIYSFYGYFPKLIYLQIIYYSICVIALSLSLAFITASLAPFFKDILNIIGILIQFGMWLTPIMWDFKMLPEKLRILFSINPMYYVVQGYRDTLIYNIPFWHHPYETICFWIITCLLFILGAILYKKLKLHFADVL
ncbi:teichoic acid translocation permease protein TagG [Oxobacter pfennigii]|uniref:Transport permease protein n=1 Tax=Oxobacter pfennigii TaxID=36849 RepID=A0A0N8NT29_9CLOT|nr:ABC transporter permease [Oxobacter pfennigii]KPU43680.1 teichoic acid translocation permease protein TagG [Oxobacter pfennigii]